MPTSDLWSIPFVIELARQVRPQRVLDVGIGFGKYGFLLREYLEIWQERYRPEQWRVRIDGIEVHGAYANPVWKHVYDEVLLTDVERWLAEPPGEPYDLALLCDVIEHFEPERGRSVLEGLLDRSRKVLVTTPLEFQEQGAVHDNPHEAHRGHWRASDFSAYHGVVHRTKVCLVALLSREPFADDLRYRLSGRWARRWMRLRGYRKARSSRRPARATPTCER